MLAQHQDTLDHEAKEDLRDIRPLREWGQLGLPLVIIVVGVDGLVRAAINFGEIFDTPGFLWGITVVAAGTSVPDAFVSMRAARAGGGITSLANVLGRNVFDLLVCIPVGVLITGASVINFSVGAPMMGVLTAVTVALFLMMRKNGSQPYRAGGASGSLPRVCRLDFRRELRRNRPCSGPATDNREIHLALTVALTRFVSGR